MCVCVHIDNVCVHVVLSVCIFGLSRDLKCSAKLRCFSVFHHVSHEGHESNQGDEADQAGDEGTSNEGDEGMLFCMFSKSFRTH